MRYFSGFKSVKFKVAFICFSLFTLMFAVSCNFIHQLEIDELQSKQKADKTVLVSLNTPTNGQIISSGFEISGSAYSSAGLENATLYISPTNGGATSETSINLSDEKFSVFRSKVFFSDPGFYNIQVKAFSKKGDSGLSSVLLVQVTNGSSPDVTNDILPPVINILSPTNNQLVGASFTVSGSYSDPEPSSGIKGVYVKVNDGNYEAASISGIVWSIQVSLTAEGANTIYAYGVDNADNVSEIKSINVLYDKGNPSINITSPASGAMFNSSALTVLGNAFIEVGSITKVQVSLNGGAYGDATGTTEWSKNLTLAEGTNAIQARVIADNGKTNSTSVWVFADTIHPTVSVSSPTEGAVLVLPTFTVSGTASDTGSGIEGIYLSVNGGSFNKIASSSPWSYNLSLSTGEHKIDVYSKDKAGNQSVTETVNFEITSSFTVYFKKPDGWGTAYIYYWPGNPPNDNGDCGNSADWPGNPMTSMDDGWYYYTFDTGTKTALIFNNNGASQTGDLFREGTGWYYNGAWYDTDPEDRIPPTIEWIEPTEDVPGVVSGNITLSVSASDNYGVSKVEFYYGSTLITTLTDAPYTTIWNTAYAHNATHEVTGKAYDEAGNTATTPVIHITTSNPNLPPVANAGSDFTTRVGRNVHFDGSGSYDPNGWIVSYEWTTGDSGNMTGVNPSHTYTETGVYQVTLTVTDNEGATDDHSITVTVLEQLESTRTDFREETIYFLMTTRFYDGDSDNNVYCWDCPQAGNVANNDPAWRGDFKGLAQKLDYIKALGFTAVWITPVVKNSSGYDYHGYHAINHSEVDPRYESPDFDYQRLIDEIHARDMKVIQDVVFNHTGNFGEENIFPLFERHAPQRGELFESIDDALTKTDPNNLLPPNYDSLSPGEQYGARIYAMKEDHTDTEHIYHHEKSMSWEGYTVQTGQIAGDCVDLHTENPVVINYLIDSYNQFIDMGVDAFRIDTVKHISRLVFNRDLLPAFKQRGGEHFYMFGEVCTRYHGVWNHDNPNISTPFYTWKPSSDMGYAWGTREQREASVYQFWQDNMSIGTQPTSGNHYLNGNSYHTPDYSQFSGQAVIDFPMHWAFVNAWNAFGVALGGDHYYNDATWNVTYVDSHDYAPDTAPEGQRFNQSQGVWAENLSLMFTFRGIPCIYYGSEIEFKKGHVIDVGPNAPLESTGRAYFGNHIEGSINVTDFGVYNNATGEMANSLNHPLARHIRKLNRIRHSIPALQKGQYSTSDISGGGMAFKRRYTGDGVDSFVLVTISGGATFNNIPNGTYKDAITGDTINVTGGSLSASVSGQGNMRVYVLDTTETPAPGQVAGDVDSPYLY
jgi:glycosidase